MATTTELAPAELAAWRGMLRVHSALVKELDAELMAQHDLPLSSYEVLISLQVATDRRLRMAELADALLLSRSGMTRLVDRLERAGYIERVSCDADGRGMYAALTDAGEDLLRRARPSHLDGVRRRFLDHFDGTELEAMGAFWERLLAPPDLTHTH